MKHTATISFDCPDTVTRSELRAFIADALGTWGGQRHPADHLFASGQAAWWVFDVSITP